jgi:hypothetical protein
LAVRVTFLGRETEHRPWTLSAPAGDVVPTFVEHPADAPADELLARVGATEPDVVVAFAPRDVPGDALAETGALTLAIVTDEGFAPGVEDVWRPDAELGPAPGLPAGYDRALTTDPLLARAAGAWRSAPLPVDDARFDAGPALDEPLPLFVGPTTTWRGFWLPELVEHYGLRQVQLGPEADAAFATATVGLCLRAERDHPGFPPTALLHLAAGHLLVTQPLRPPRGLEPGLDHIEVSEPVELLHLLFEVRKRPAAFDHVRLRGRARMELFRASVIWPRVLADLVADVAAYGRRAVSPGARASAV